MVKLDTQQLEAVFQSRPDILKGIRKAADTHVRIDLFNDIASFVHEQLNGSEPAQKKRKLDGTGASATAAATVNGNVATPTSADVEGESILLEIKDISCSIPQRKKFDLCFTQKHLFARLGGAPVSGMIYSWKDFEYSFYFTVPEKTQLQYNYILMPKGSSLLGLQKTTPPGAVEPLVFTVPGGAPKPGTIGGTAAAAAANFSDSWSTLIHWSLSHNLPQHARILSPNPEKFKSVIRQPHRPKEPAVHVRAHIGSKEGYLFFMETGIFWGFKKPLLYIPVEQTAAISYTSVLRTTFNMVVEVMLPGEGEATEEIEFGMIDQADYPGIDERYVKKNRLQDRSMAEQRKAKKELADKENAGKKNGKSGYEMVVDDDGGEATAAAAKASGRSLLEQLQWDEEQKLQDEEDEEEEDYEPGGSDDSEGSGSDDDDDDDDEDDE